MGFMGKNYITSKGFQRLREEYSKLLNEERPKVVEVVQWAASNGDRSENADYLYGKKRLREIDKRLYFLQKKLESAEVVDLSQIKGDLVVFGCRVSFEDEDGKEQTYQIVGEDEFDPNEKKISWKSPVAKALLGKRVGDEVTLSAPKGEQLVQIIKIEVPSE
jgi:transcription elongation factor GreB